MDFAQPQFGGGGVLPSAFDADGRRVDHLPNPFQERRRAAAAANGQPRHDPLEERARRTFRAIITGIAAENLVDRPDNRVDAVGFLFPFFGVHGEHFVNQAGDVFPGIASGLQLDDFGRLLQEVLDDQIALDELLLHGRFDLRGLRRGSCREDRHQSRGTGRSLCLAPRLEPFPPEADDVDARALGKLRNLPHCAGAERQHVATPKRERRRPLFLGMAGALLPTVERLACLCELRDVQELRRLLDGQFPVRTSEAPPQIEHVRPAERGIVAVKRRSSQRDLAREVAAGSAVMVQLAQEGISVGGRLVALGIPARRRMQEDAVHVVVGEPLAFQFTSNGIRHVEDRSATRAAADRTQDDHARAPA